MLCLSPAEFIATSFCILYLSIIGSFACYFLLHFVIRSFLPQHYAALLCHYMLDFAFSLGSMPNFILSVQGFTTGYTLLFFWLPYFSLLCLILLYCSGLMLAIPCFNCFLFSFTLLHFAFVASACWNDCNCIVHIILGFLGLITCDTSLYSATLWFFPCHGCQSLLSFACYTRLHFLSFCWIRFNSNVSIM